MKVLREAQLLPFPDLVEHARGLKKVIDNTVIRLQRQEAKRATWLSTRADQK